MPASDRVFDLLCHGNRDLREVPIEDRRAALQAVLVNSGPAAAPQTATRDAGWPRTGSHGSKAWS